MACATSTHNGTIDLDLCSWLSLAIRGLLIGRNRVYTKSVRTIFLDFDGVVHPEFCHESKHFCCLLVFEQVLRHAPDWSVVISSTWRHQYSMEILRSRFSADVAHRVIGATPRFNQLENIPDALLGYEREAECNAWLRENGRIAFPWLAIDDRPWLYRPFSPSLFLVNGKTGLTAARADELVQRLYLL